MRMAPFACASSGADGEKRRSLVVKTPAGSTGVEGGVLRRVPSSGCKFVCVFTTYSVTRRQCFVTLSVKLFLYVKCECAFARLYP